MKCPYPLLKGFLLLILFMNCKQQNIFRGKSSGENNTEPVSEADLDRGKRLSCRKEGKIWNDQSRSCMSEKEFCLSKQDGSIWRTVGDSFTCLSKRDQCLLETGSEWTGTVCLSAREICEKNNDGSKFTDGVCLTPEGSCLKRGYHYKWSSSEQSCELRTFLDYCRDQKPEEATLLTVREIRRVATVTLELTEEASCQQTKDWLSTSDSLRLLDTRDRLLLTDIYPIAEFVQLERLELTNNRIKDIYPLSRLINLEFLDLQNNQVLTFLDDLAGLEKLRYLFLGYNRIIDLSPLASLKNLRMLSLFDNQISELSPLEGLSNLEALHLKSNPIRSLYPLRNLHKLTELDIGLTPVGRGDIPLTETNCPKEGKISETIRNFCEQARSE